VQSFKSKTIHFPTYVYAKFVLRIEAFRILDTPCIVLFTNATNL